MPPSRRDAGQRQLMSEHEALELAGLAQGGDRHALARLITQIERGAAAAQHAAFSLPVDPAGHVIGVTGPPGVGKSTLVNAVTQHLRAEGHTVAVLAVDPSSPLSGGALLGDRVRMVEHSADEGVFIRSMANRGQLGGMSTAVPAATRAVLACGFDKVLIETVGVGQSEVAIAAHADTTVVVSAPGAGDFVQASKAGLLEVADVMVVNKADRDGARGTGRDLRDMLAIRRVPAGTWEVPVVMTQADSGEGVGALVAALHGHLEAVRASGRLAEARSARAESEFRVHAKAQLLMWLDARLREGAGGAVQRVRNGEQSPLSAAEQLIVALDRSVERPTSAHPSRHECGEGDLDRES